MIRLVYFVRVPRHEARKITRRALFARDGYSCQYCGASSRLTMDHVVPRSRGGRSNWDNVVTSCAPCNSRKGDHLPGEVEMFPKTKPRPPSPSVFIAVAAPKRPKSWERYLASLAAQDSRLFSRSRAAVTAAASFSSIRWASVSTASRSPAGMTTAPAPSA